MCGVNSVQPRLPYCGRAWEESSSGPARVRVAVRLLLSAYVRCLVHNRELHATPDPLATQTAASSTCPASSALELPSSPALKPEEATLAPLSTDAGLAEERGAITPESVSAVSPESVNGDVVGEVFKCSLCPLTFPTSVGKQVHELACRKQIKCRHCGRTFGKNNKGACIAHEKSCQGVAWQPAAPVKAKPHGRVRYSSARQLAALMDSEGFAMQWQPAQAPPAPIAGGDASSDEARGAAHEESNLLRRGDGVDEAAAEALQEAERE